MRVRAMVAAAVAGVFAASAAPAGAADYLTRIELRASGKVKVVWHGDQTHGCAAAGLCGYSGSIVYPFRRGAGFIERAQTGPHSFLDYFGFIESPGRTVARTERAVAGGEPAVCSQRSRQHPFTLSFANAWRGRRWMTLGTSIFPSLLASGQCAGPRLEDFAGQLPSTLVRRHELERRGARVSLAGRFPFRSGPLRGQVISTLRLKSRGIHRSRLLDGETDEDEPRGKHVLYVELRFRATRVAGELRNDFRAVGAPICELRDACGTHGSELYSLDDTGRTVEVSGFAATRSRRRPSLKGALRKVLNDGFLGGGFDVRRASGLTTHAFVRPGAVTCTDRFAPREPPFLDLYGEQGRLALVLFTREASILRGRCPGPADAQSGGEEIARLRVSRSQLLKRAVLFQLRSRRDFRTGAYKGTRTARVNVRLRRTRARVLVDPKFGGEGGLFVSGIRPRQRP